MKLWDIAGIVLTLSALFGFVNRRYLGLPGNIGPMLVALVLSLALIVLQLAGFGLAADARRVVESIDFSATLFHGMLGYLLFAGALRLELNALLAEKWNILTLAIASTLLSTLLVGLGAYAVLMALGLGIPIIFCFLFGALISPTDPVAILAVLRDAGLPRELSSQIAGESLFNDGIGVALFLVLLGVANGAQSPSPSEVIFLFFTEVLGGVAFGLAAGFMAYWLIKQIDDYVAEILITLALVTGGYALADHLRISAPIAMVIAGLLIGNQGRRLAMSDRTRQILDIFWELIDGILNAVLFVLIGLEILSMTLQVEYLWGVILIFLTVLCSRLLSVGLPVSILRVFHKLPSPAIRLLTWGGLRGGLAVAMALSLPEGNERTVLVAITYGTVVVSILVQGGTMAYLTRKFFHDD